MLSGQERGTPEKDSRYLPHRAWRPARLQDWPGRGCRRLYGEAVPTGQAAAGDSNGSTEPRIVRSLRSKKCDAPVARQWLPGSLSATGARQSVIRSLGSRPRMLFPKGGQCLPEARDLLFQSGVGFLDPRQIAFAPHFFQLRGCLDSLPCKQISCRTHEGVRCELDCLGVSIRDGLSEPGKVPGALRQKYLHYLP